MALESSGALSIGGSTLGRSINLEIGRVSTATSSLNETQLRELAEILSGTISIADFYGKASIAPPPSIEYLIVGGGGGGGSDSSRYFGCGGGGGGGVLTGTLATTSSVTLNITVGSGGAENTNGNPSSIDTLVAFGGGYGGTNSRSPGNGGSGGGAGYRRSIAGIGTLGQGHNGGNSGGYYYGAAVGAGGGGASAIGNNAGTKYPGAYPNVGGNGGLGFLSSISGTAKRYGGGGGGGAYIPNTYDIDSSEGGNGGTTNIWRGNGSGTEYNERNSPTFFQAGNGEANTGEGGGGGGGGSYTANYHAGSGGSGVVIIRYLDIYRDASDTTGSPTVTTSGGYKIYKFTNSGSITF